MKQQTKRICMKDHILTTASIKKAAASKPALSRRRSVLAMALLMPDSDKE